LPELPAACVIGEAGREFARANPGLPEETARQETDESCRKPLRDIRLGNVTANFLFMVLLLLASF
jgi:hypothetical protein